MKSKFLRIISLILVLASLVSMFGVFAYADSSAVGTSDGDDPNVPEETDPIAEVLKEFPNFELQYQRNFEEGWAFNNGLSWTNRGSSVEIDHELTADYDYNYFMRFTTGSSEHTYLELNFNNTKDTGAVIEFDLMSDDYCHFPNLFQFATPGSGTSRTFVNFIGVNHNAISFFTKSDAGHMLEDGTSTVGRDPLENPNEVISDANLKEWSKISDQWLHVALVLDFTYGDVVETDPDTGEITNKYTPDPNPDAKRPEPPSAGGNEDDSNPTNYKNYFTMSLYIAPTDEYKKTGELYLVDQRTVRGVTMSGGEGISWIRISSSSTPQEYWDTSICFDNLVYYTGANKYGLATEAMGNGSKVNTNAEKVYEVIGGSSSKSDADYIKSAVAMKLGVDYMRVDGEQVAICKDENGNAVGAPFKNSDGDILIPLLPILDAMGYKYYMHEDGLYLDISSGSSSSYLSVGKTNATVDGQRVILSVAPGYKDGVLYIGLDDFDSLIPGRYAKYDSMGLIVVSEKDFNFDRSLYLSAMLDIMKSFVFDFATPDEIIEDVRENTNNFEHPYILGNKDEFDWLRQVYNASNGDENYNYYLKNAIETVIRNADDAYKVYARPIATIQTKNVTVTDEDGNKIQQTDENGNPVFDENGNPVYKTEEIPVISWGAAYDRTHKNFTYDAFDNSGAIILDANGNAPYVQAKDEDGNLLVDSDGDPIFVKAKYNLTEGENGPVYVLDEEYKETETDRFGNTVDVRYYTEVSVDEQTGVRTPLYLIKYVSKFYYNYTYDTYLGIFDDGIDYNGDGDTDELYYHIVDKYGASAYKSYSLTQPDFDNGGQGYDIEGGRCNASSSRNERAANIAFAWQMTRDVRYLLEAYDMAVSLGALWKHWGPGHFLNCADAATPFAYMLDMCYDGFLALGSSDYAAELAALGVSEEGIQNVTNYNASMGRDNTYYDVKDISNILYEKGVWEGYISSHDLHTTYLSPIVGTGGSLYRTRTNNWNAVCSSGMIIAALAVIDCDFVSDDFEVKGKYSSAKTPITLVDENGVSIVEGTIQQHAAWLISNNVKNLVTYGLDCYAPDGAYNESPTYWSYGTNTFFRMCLVLDSAAGTNYGLMDCWGIDTTCYYACQTETNEFRTFSYHDGGMSSQDTSMFFYASESLGDDALAQVRLSQIAGGKGMNIYDIMAYPRRDLAESEAVALDYYSEGIDLYAARSSWERGALYVGIIGGANQHPHNQIDAGTFVYHNNGAPWFLDLGTENYNAVGFWPDATRYRYYVMKPEGHNTITVTSDTVNVPWGQKLSGVAYAYDYGYNEYGSYVKYEMTNVLGGTADSWKRAVMLTNNRTTTIIQDEISSNGVQSYYWFGHYSLRYVKDVELSDDGRTAYMYGIDSVTVDDSKLLRVTIVSPQTDLRFELMDTYTFVHNDPDTGTYSKEWVNAQGPDENDRSQYRKLAIAGGGQLGLTFNVAIVIELISKDEKASGREPDVEYTWTEIKDWEEPVKGYTSNAEEGAETRPAASRKDFGSNVQRALEMFDNKTAFNTNFTAFYRTLTDSYYIYSILQSQLGSGYAEQIRDYNTMKSSFASFRAAVFKISATRDGVVSKLLGQ